MAASRHLWVGGLPEDMSEDDVRNYFTRYGKVETVKLLPQKHANIGLAAFIDYFELEAAKEVRNADIKMKGREVRTNYKSVRPETKQGKEHSRRYYNSPHSKNDSSNSSSTGSSSDSDTSVSSSGSESDSSKQNVSTLKVTNLPHQSDTELLDVLNSEFTRYSNKITVKIYGDKDNKYSLVKFKRNEDCKKALRESEGVSIGGSKIKLSQYNKDIPNNGREHKPKSMSSLEDIDSNAARSLFVGNIPKNISIYELRDIFQRYGPVVDVEIKKMSGNATYGFILYYDLHHAITAKKFMDGTVVSGNNIRVGFGKGTPSKMLWIDSIDSSVTKQQIEKQCSKYGRIIRLGYDHYKGTAMVQYDTLDEAKEALSKLKGSTTIGNNHKKIMADFANKESRVTFFTRLERAEGPTRPPPFHPAGPMYSVDGMPSMMGGFHPAPIDYYRPYPPPHMDGHYGLYNRPHVPLARHSCEPRGIGDYEDELRAFSRKRERERRLEKEDERKKKHHRKGYSSGDESDTSRRARYKGKIRHHSSSSTSPRRDKKVGNSSDDCSHKDTRVQNTRKSHEHREKQRNNSSKRNSEKRAKTSPAVPEHDNNEPEKKGERNIVESEKVVEPKKDDDNKHNNEINEPKIVINYEDEDRADEKKAVEKEENTAATAMEKVVQASMESKENVIKEEATPPLPIDEETDATPPPSPLKESLLPVNDRPKITIAWKERDKRQFQQQDEQDQLIADISTRIESDLSSGEDFEHMDEEHVDNGGNKTAYKVEKENIITTEEHEAILGHQSGTSSDGSGRKGINKNNKNRSPSRDRRQRIDNRHKEVGMGGGREERNRKRNEHHSSNNRRNTTRYQDHRKHRLSPSPRGRLTPPIKSRSPLSPPRGRPRTPIQRPPKVSRHRPHNSPQHDMYRGRHGHSPPYIRRKDIRSEPRERRDVPRDRSPRRNIERSRPADSPPPNHRNSPRHLSRHRHNSRSPSPPRYTLSRHRKDDPRIDPVVSHPRTPSGSPPPLPPVPSEEPTVEKVEKQQQQHQQQQHQQQQQQQQQQHQQQQQLDEMPKVETHAQLDAHDLLRKYPVIWQGHFVLKSELVTVQLHYLSGNSNLAQISLPVSTDGNTSTVRISQRMKMEQSQLVGVENRIKNPNEHCLLLALPCGRDHNDVQTQASLLNNSIINYLLQKQAAGIVNVQKNEASYVFHIFPPCSFSTTHLSQVASDLLNSTSDNCHLLIIIATNSS